MLTLKRAAVAMIAALAAFAPAAAAAPTTTLQRTIQDRDGDNLLEFSPGDEFCVFLSEGPKPRAACPSEDDDPSPDGDLRRPRDASILNFVHQSDFQMIDEESPGRVEFLDGSQRVPGANPFSAAYRPQESLTTQLTEAMVRQVRNTVSPVTSEPVDLSILTGDNADSQQYNETRWFIDILDGTDGPKNPAPENSDGEDPGTDRKIDPDSGIGSRAPSCDLTPNNPYDGVRGGGVRGASDDGYYEPDGSQGQREDGDGYSPDRQRNKEETKRPDADVTVRDFPGLLENAQDEFEAVGLDIPWYSAFGNHDALIQGNSSDAYTGPAGPSGEHENQFYKALVTGCLKPSKLPTGTDDADFLTDPFAGGREGTAPAGSQPLTVPPDPRRCYLAKDEPEAQTGGDPCRTGGFIQQHFRSTGTPVGHGFAPSAALDENERQAGLGRPATAMANHDGYYSFRPRPGVRFVVLDSITDECGVPVCSEGSIDDTQFEWLKGQLAQAGAREYVMVFSHHTLRTMRSPSIDGTEEPIHRGERVDRRDGQPQPPSEGVTLEELYCENRNVIAHVSGHEHENYVENHRCGEDAPQTPGPGQFLEVSTASHLDFSQQSRMIELVDNGDRTMSLALTLIDHDGPANPGGAPPPDGERGHAPREPARLAGIGREIAYNDYQGSRSRGREESDRNVIVRLGADRPPPAVEESEGR